MELSHVDENGVKMVDVGNKEYTNRVAKAHAKVVMNKETIKLLVDVMVSRAIAVFPV